MNSEEHDNIIEQLKLQIREDKATFGIFQYGGGTDECYIKADKEGLRLFALELLIAAQKMEEVIEDTKQNIIPISYQENWIDQDSDIFVQYIDPVRKRAVTPYTEVKNTVSDKLVTGGCILLFIFIILSVLVGAVSIIKWIF